MAAEAGVGDRFAVDRIALGGRAAGLCRADAASAPHDERQAIRTPERIRDPMILLRIARKTAPNLKESRAQMPQCAPHDRPHPARHARRGARRRAHPGGDRAGIVALIGVRKSDDERERGPPDRRACSATASSRTPTGRMNLDLGSVGGGLLLVPQFTLAADTTRGMRPGFSTAAAPESGTARSSSTSWRSAARAPSPVALRRVRGAHAGVADQ